MLNLEKVQGLIFDYGGTIDSNGVHWSEVIWKAYQEVNIPINKNDFREAYVFGERTLARNLLILPSHNFMDILRIKIDLQQQWLNEHGLLPEKEDTKHKFSQIAFHAYGTAKFTVAQAIPVLTKLKERYPIVLVSNFYGNIKTVLQNFYLDKVFNDIVESAVVGVRKPDPMIFRLGLEKLGLSGDKVLVIGDSYEKDIVPAASLGCQTVWLKNTGWKDYTGEEKADKIITDFSEIADIFNL